LSSLLRIHSHAQRDQSASPGQKTGSVGAPTTCLLASPLVHLTLLLYYNIHFIGPRPLPSSRPLIFRAGQFELAQFFALAACLPVEESKMDVCALWAQKGGRTHNRFPVARGVLPKRVQGLEREIRLRLFSISRPVMHIIVFYAGKTGFDAVTPGGKTSPLFTNAGKWEFPQRFKCMQFTRFARKNAKTPNFLTPRKQVCVLPLNARGVVSSLFR